MDDDRFTDIVPRSEDSITYCARSPLVACKSGLDGRAGFEWPGGAPIVGCQCLFMASSKLRFV